MKHVIFILLVLVCFQSNAQQIRFSNTVYKALDVVSSTPKHVDPQNTGIKISSDIGQNPDITVSSDRKARLGQLPSDGIYNIRIGFDTLLTRYFQGMVIAGSHGEPTFKERFPLKISNLDSARMILSLLIDSIRTDSLESKKITVKGALLFSFKLYTNDQGITVLTTSYYSLSGDCKQLQGFLKAKNESLFKDAAPHFFDLLNASFSLPSLIQPIEQIDLADMKQFALQKKKHKTPMQLYTKQDIDEYSFILNQP